MENTALKDLINEFRSIEIKAHVNLDDVLNKVTQEVWELVEAIIAWDMIEMKKEAADSMVNIISASAATWVEFEDRNGSLDLQNINKDFGSMFVSLSRWNQDIQAIRWRYSRDVPSLTRLEESTSRLVWEILSYIDPSLSLSNIITSLINKFTPRVEAYKSKIDLKEYIWEYSNFPKKWIEFKDISPLLESEEAMKYICFELAQKCSWADVIAWLDARWFLFGPRIAEILSKPFVMIRKKWKLPWNTIWESYSLEYWENEIEIQEKAISKWQKVALIDDLLATWGTILAAANLVEKAWWKVNNIACVISLDEEDLLSCEARKEIAKYGVGSVISYNYFL